MLLAAHGIAAREQEMIDLCLTTRRGTPALGLYRGVKLKTRGTSWDVDVIRGSIDELCRGGNWPALLRMTLPGDERHAGLAIGGFRYTQRPEHVVLMHGVDANGQAVLVDPATDCEHRWYLTDLANLWTGEGLRLVPKTPIRSPGQGEVAGCLR